MVTHPKDLVTMIMKKMNRKKTMMSLMTETMVDLDLVVEKPQRSLSKPLRISSTTRTQKR